MYKIFFSVISSGLIEQKEEVQLDDQAGENDYSAILTVFNDILTSIKRNIADELGDRSYSLFEEIKSDLGIEFKEVLKDYHPDNHKNSNLQAVGAAMDKIDIIEDQKEFLITGFTEYCALVLKKVGEILGAQPLSKILSDIEKVLGYVKKYQAGSKEKSKIVNDMQNVISKIHAEFKMEKKTGIFSIFSR